MKKEYKFNLKSSWKDITIEDYQRIKRLGDDIKNTEFIAILSDMNVEEVSDLPIEVIEKIIDELDFFFNDDEPVSPIEPVRTEIYTWDLLTDVKQLTASQFIDIAELTKDSTKFLENLHMIIAIITEKKESRWYWWDKPIKYKDRNLMEDAKYIQKNFPINHALGMSSFFLSILETSQINIGDYLDLEE